MRRFALGLTLTFGFILQTTLAQAQTAQTPEKPVVVVSTLDAPVNDLTAQRIANTVSQSIGVVLRLTGSLTVNTADFLDPVLSYQRAALYYAQENARFAIFGTVAPAAGGGYSISVSLWNGGSPSAKPQVFQDQIADVFSVFDAADSVALSVASQAVGKKLASGTLALKGVQNLKDYGVYVDGQLLARNSPTVRVLSGKRTIIVAVPGTLGDQPIQTFDATINADQTTELTVTAQPSSATASTAAPSGGAASTGAASAGAAAAGGASAQAAPKPTGGLKVTTTPAGATVLLDQKVIGTTPLNLFGVPVGKYDLTIQRKYFRTIDQVADIRENADNAVDVKMEINPTDPDIVARSIDVRGVTIGASLWTLGQISDTLLLVLSSVGNDTDYTATFWQPELTSDFAGSAILYADIGITNIFLRVGHRLTGDPLQTAIIDGISGLGLLMFANPLVPMAFGLQPSSLSETLEIGGLVLEVGTMAYDLATTPLSALRENSDLYAYVSAHGELPPVRVTQPHHFLIETGDGGLLRGGYRLQVIPDYLAAEAVAGIGVDPTTTALDGSGTVRLSWNPFGAKSGNLRPEVNLGMTVGTDLSDFNLALNLGTGLDWNLGIFDLYTRGGISYSATVGQFGESLAVGTRLF